MAINITNGIMNIVVASQIDLSGEKKEEAEKQMLATMKEATICFFNAVDTFDKYNAPTHPLLVT